MATLIAYASKDIDFNTVQSEMLDEHQIDACIVVLYVAWVTH